MIDLPQLNGFRPKKEYLVSFFKQREDGECMGWMQV